MKIGQGWMHSLFVSVFQPAFTSALHCRSEYAPRQTTSKLYPGTYKKIDQAKNK